MTEKQAKRCINRVLEKLFVEIPGVEIAMRAKYPEGFDFYRFEDELAATLKGEYES